MRFTKSSQNGWSSSPFSIMALLESAQTASNEAANRTETVANPVVNSLNNDFRQQVVISDPELQAWDMIKSSKVSSSGGSTSVRDFSLSIRSTGSERSGLDRWENETLVYGLGNSDLNDGSGNGNGWGWRRRHKSPPHPGWVWCNRHNCWHPKDHSL
jgi:hypothetical protein